MAAKAIMERGSRWAIGNGEKVSIEEDHWLPTSEAFKVVSLKPPQAESELVAELIDMDRQNWDVAKIRGMFLPHEANVILRIPISPRLPRDSLIWAWTPRGIFTVNSAHIRWPKLYYEKRIPSWNRGMFKHSWYEKLMEIDLEFELSKK